ncbi:MAG: ATP synthase F1 subunit delta [Candidatus Aminicenantes bacterium]|nr:ATP synthase F1 subunit delta [Candidatus Aminicenantes bacterium]
MNKRILVKRYAQGFLNTIKDESEFQLHYRELLEFEELLAGQKKLQELFQSQFLPLSKKKDLVRELSDRSKFQPKNKRYILLLIENGRIDLFQDILEYLPELWNELKGIATFEVSSVIPLTEGQRKKLEEKLERLEEKPVFLKFREDPSLIGGISVRRGNIVYDASIQGNLERLKEKIIEG